MALVVNVAGSSTTYTYAVANQTFTVPYQARTGGVALNLGAVGGHVDRLRLWPAGTSHSLTPAADVGPAVVQTDGIRWLFTVTPLAAGLYEAQIDYTTNSGGPAVADTNDTLLVLPFDGVLGGATALASLDDVKNYLNITSVDSARDLELQVFLDTATAMIEDRCGPILPRTVTETTRGSGSIIVLRNAAVLSVTTITDIYGPGASRSITIADPEESSSGSYTAFLDTTTGMLRRVDGSAWGPNVRVTYTAGYATVPAQARLACLELVRHLYGPQRGPRQAGVFPTTDPVMPGATSSFAMPYRVLEILGTLIRTPGVA